MGDGIVSTHQHRFGSGDTLPPGADPFDTEPPVHLTGFSAKVSALIATVVVVAAALAGWLAFHG